MRLETTIGPVTVHFVHNRKARGTVCWLHPQNCSTRPCENHLFMGLALVHPNDQFCKRTGRKVALAKAMADLPRNYRKAIWDGYFEVVGRKV